MTSTANNTSEQKKEPSKMEFGFAKKKSVGTPGCSGCGQNKSPSQYSSVGANTASTTYKGGCGGCGKNRSW